MSTTSVPEWIPVTKDTLPPMHEWVVGYNFIMKEPVLVRLDYVPLDDGEHYRMWRNSKALYSAELTDVITHWCKVEIPPAPQKE